MPVRQMLVAPGSGTAVDVNTRSLIPMNCEAGLATASSVEKYRIVTLLITRLPKSISRFPIVWVDDAEVVPASNPSM